MRKVDLSIYILLGKITELESCYLKLHKIGVGLSGNLTDKKQVCLCLASKTVFRYIHIQNFRESCKILGGSCSWWGGTPCRDEQLGRKPQAGPGGWSCCRPRSTINILQSFREAKNKIKSEISKCLWKMIEMTLLGTSQLEQKYHYISLLSYFVY